MPHYAKLQCNWVQQPGHRWKIGCEHNKRNPYLYSTPMSRGLCPIIYAENIMEFAFFASRRWLKMCFHYEFCSCGLVFFQTVFCLIQYVNSLLCKSHTIFFLLTMLTRKKQGICLHVVQMPQRNILSCLLVYLVLSFSKICFVWHDTWTLSPQCGSQYLVFNDNHQG